MHRRFVSDQWLGLLVCGAALLLLVVWIPADIETGITEKIRRQVRLGDSLGPAVAGAVILLGGVMCLLRPNPGDPRLGRDNLRWLARLLTVIGVSLLIIRFVGPFAVELLAEPSYRALRATPPWNYAGFLMGGTVLIAGLIAAMTGRLTARAVLIGFGASLAIAAFYDLPFDDLQLPPNGDV